MSAARVYVTIMATQIWQSQVPPDPVIGQTLFMEDGDIRIHITPEIARQWIETLAPIAEQEGK